MAEKLKSALELAMERLSRKGMETPAKLTAAQKKKIAAIRQEYTAKLAEQEILHESEKLAVAEDPEKQERLEAEHRRHREILAGHQEERIRKIRERGKS